MFRHLIKNPVSTLNRCSFFRFDHACHSVCHVLSSYPVKNRFGCFHNKGFIRYSSDSNRSRFVVVECCSNNLYVFYENRSFRILTPAVLDLDGNNRFWGIHIKVVLKLQVQIAFVLHIEKCVSYQ